MLVLQVKELQDELKFKKPQIMKPTISSDKKVIKTAFYNTQRPITAKSPKKDGGIGFGSTTQRRNLEQSPRKDVIDEERLNSPTEKVRRKQPIPIFKRSLQKHELSRSILDTSTS